MNSTYYRTTSYTTSTVDTAALGAVLGIYALIMVIVAIIMIVSYWKIFTKAGKPGWASLIPFYNLYTMFEVAGMSGWMFLLLLVPVANVVVMIMMSINLAKAFGKTGGFVVGLILLGVIFFPILAFGNAKYIGTSSNTKTTEQE